MICFPALNRNVPGTLALLSRHAAELPSTSYSVSLLVIPIRFLGFLCYRVPLFGPVTRRCAVTCCVAAMTTSASREPKRPCLYPRNHPNGNETPPACLVDAGGAAAVPVIVPRSFSLSDEEASLFSALKSFIASSHGKVSETQLRAAGGWVRDKLLGRACHDVDIVLDNMTGEEFASQFNQHRVAHGFAPHTIGVIQSNPAQSKHLATATMRIDDLFLDFVNLRTETYADGSRIPDATCFGTPQEDAFRRDFTINALFYNVHTDVIEDFTGRGLRDLGLRRLATPIDPFVTLKDDALRLLRGLRFAAVLNLSLDPEFIAAARDPVVRHHLATVISRERVGQEIDKMLLEGSPLRSLTLLCRDANVADLVFDTSAHGVYENVWRDLGLSLVERLEASVELVDPQSQQQNAACQWIINHESSHRPQLQVSADTRRSLAYAAFLFPLRDAVVDESSASTASDSQSGKPVLLPFAILTKSLKLKRRQATVVESLHKAAALWIKLLHDYHSEALPDNSENSVTRILRLDSDFTGDWKTILGVTLRHIGQPYWQQALLLACVVEDSTPLWKSADSMYKLICCVTEKHIFQRHPLNGSDLKKLLPKIPPGPAIQSVLNYEIQLCINDPSLDIETVRSRMKLKFSMYL